VPFYRNFPDDSTKENLYDELSGTAYIVRKEYDVRFFCTWTQDDAFATGFSLQFGDNFTSYEAENMTQLKNISKGYVVPLSKEFFETQIEVN